MKLKAVLFGAAGGGERLLGEVLKSYEVLCVTDNDSTKWGGTLKGISILSPEDAFKKPFDHIVITSAPGCGSITEQLLALGILEESIVTRYVDTPLKTRILFLELYAKLMHEKNIDGCCAEAGVFQGDFAKWINHFFPEKQLYLFDTFEGFHQQDVSFENKNGLSQIKQTDYSNASIEMVLNKMEFPQQCVVRKGYFPDTTTGIDEEFCFVNLDLDLYQPTLGGLEWFKDRMVHNGIILVHDYFVENFKGPKRAVDEFVEKYKEEKYQVLPIGDGISVMIVGF